MGEFLARLHRALRSFHHPGLLVLRAPCDEKATLARVDELIGLVEGLGGNDPVDAWALDRLRSRRQWLQSEEDTGVPISHLPVQGLHGDYQESNLFFDKHGVSAVIDWDKALVGPREWELVRLLDLALHLDPTRGKALLDGYARGGEVVGPEDLRLAASAYSSMRAHDLWLYETVYRDGNARARVFITPGRFVPFAARWDAFWCSVWSGRCR